MSMNNGIRIWHQAVTRALMDGKVYGAKKTAAFRIRVPFDTCSVRLRFTNIFGEEPCAVGSVTIAYGGSVHTVMAGGRYTFNIPVGERLWSDDLELSADMGSEIEVRIYCVSGFVDCNMTEEFAYLLEGDHTYDRRMPGNIEKPLLGKILGAYNPVPSIDVVEAEPRRAVREVSPEEAGKAASPDTEGQESDAQIKTIVAFGDSITALSKWTVPLSERLAESYPGKYVLLNSGIAGNCLLHSAGGLLGKLFGGVYGEPGVRRFRRDVLEAGNLSTVIIALGVNDVSYLNDETKYVINEENFARAITEMTDELHRRGVRVVMQTITPRLGVAITMGKFTREMEELRLRLNEWIRSAGIFDYVIDQEETVRDERADGYYFCEGLHQGDHLHPNDEGGRLMAEAYDLEKLTGEKL